MIPVVVVRRVHLERVAHVRRLVVEALPDLGRQLGDLRAEKPPSGERLEEQRPHVDAALERPVIVALHVALARARLKGDGRVPALALYLISRLTAKPS